MRNGHTLTLEAARRLKKLLDDDRFAPPRRKQNTRPFDALGSGGIISYVIASVTTATTGPYTGLKIATVNIKVAPLPSLIGEDVEVVDHDGCYFDIAEDLAGYSGQASEGYAWSLDAEADCETVTPKHWFATNICCGPNTGLYADPCA